MLLLWLLLLLLLLLLLSLLLLFLLSLSLFLLFLLLLLLLLCGRRCCCWHAHVERGHDAHAWSPHLLKWQDQTWLWLRRLCHSAVGESRTNTRALRGGVHRRWEEGLETA